MVNQYLNGLWSALCVPISRFVVAPYAYIVDKCYTNRIDPFRFCKWQRRCLLSFKYGEKCIFYVLSFYFFSCVFKALDVWMDLG